MSVVKNLIRDLRKSRMYTEDMLSNVDQADWFRQPSEGVTHVAWQVGHLAVAQFSLALKRVRGEETADGELIPPEFRKLLPVKKRAPQGALERSNFSPYLHRQMAEASDLLSQKGHLPPSPNRNM